jgi:hypothetical protein
MGTEINCSVKSIHEEIDIICLEPQYDESPDSVSVKSKIVNYPPPSTTAYSGQQIILLGFSPSWPFASQVKSGLIVNSNLVDNVFVLGDIQSIPGDSGGPCIDFYTGALVGVHLGNRTFPNKDKCSGVHGILNVIVPIYVILGYHSVSKSSSENKTSSSPKRFCFTDGSFIEFDESE